MAAEEVVKRKSTNFTRCSTYYASDKKISSQVELQKMKVCIWLVNYFHYVCAKLRRNRTTFSERGLARKKSGQSKRHKLHEMLDLLCFQWQDLGSKGAQEVESLHVPNQLFPLCLWQTSSRSNIFEGKRASEAKFGQPKKQKNHELLDLVYFQSQSLESWGT